MKIKLLINNQFFQSKPWIHVVLQTSATDKLVDIDPWNFDTRNVKQYTKGGKKEKYRVMTMRGTPSIYSAAHKKVSSSLEANYIDCSHFK